MSEPEKKNPTSASHPAKTLTILKQVIWDTHRHAQEAELPLVASSLAYTTILSIVPALAVSFSIFQAFGGMEKLFEQIEPLILENLAQGAGKEATQALRRYINNAHAGALGAGGILALLVTTMTMLSSIEKAINRVWRARIERNWFQRVSSYWLFVTLGPVALGVIVGFAVTFFKAADGAATFLSTDSKKAAQGLISALTPVVFVVYFLIYRYVPNRSVRIRSAVLGALFGTVAWSMAKWGYGIYTKKFVSYNRVYGSMGAIPILLLWIYIQWLVVLYGAALSAAIQKRIEALRDALQNTRNGVASIIVFMIGVALASPCLAAPLGQTANEKTAYPRVAWFTVTQGLNTPFAIYSESIERTGDRLRHQNHTWKKVNGLFVEEHIGAFTEDSAQLTPLFFHYSRMEPEGETRVDLTFQRPASIFTARVTQGKGELPIVRREVPVETIFSITFSEWAWRNGKKLAPLKSLAFGSIQEDSWDRGFAPVNGKITRSTDSPEGKIQFKVEHNQMTSTWTYTPTGEIQEILMPAAQLRIKRSTETEARRFIGLPSEMTTMRPIGTGKK